VRRSLHASLCPATTYPHLCEPPTRRTGSRSLVHPAPSAPQCWGVVTIRTTVYSRVLKRVLR
jgi:hypothetical protein